MRNIWRWFQYWLEHKLNPHCQHCEDLVLDSKVCNSCEVLKLENARLLDLIDKLTTPVKSEEEDKTDYSNLKPIRPAHIPWNVKRQELEQSDRATARAAREASNAPKSDITAIKELEDEVLGAEV